MITYDGEEYSFPSYVAVTEILPVSVVFILYEDSEETSSPSIFQEYSTPVTTEGFVFTLNTFPVTGIPITEIPSKVKSLSPTISLILCHPEASPVKRTSTSFAEYPPKLTLCTYFPFSTSFG